MEQSDNRETPDRGASNLPVHSRNFTTSELEAVIRRAVELQAGNPARTEEGVSEIELLRIGQELGLDPAMVRRAMAEVRGRPVQERGALVGLVGTGTVSATRVLHRPAAAIASTLDRYLCDKELMVAQRRFPDRTQYVRDNSFAAGVSRLTRGFSRAYRPLNLNRLEVAVSSLGPESCLVELTVDLTGTRAGLAAGMLGSSTVIAAGWGVTAWAAAIASPLALLGVPIVAGSWFGMRAIYRTIRASVQDKLESLLDRAEHDELT